MEAGREQRDSVTRFLLILGALGGSIGVFAPVGYIAVVTWPSVDWLYRLWLDSILFAVWYSLMGFGFLGLHRRYGKTCPSWITLLALVTAVLEVVYWPLYSYSFLSHIISENVYNYELLGRATTLAIGGYALIQAKEQSRNRVLMEVTGGGLIVGGIAIATTYPIIWLVTSVACILMLVLFVEEYRVRGHS